VASAVSVIIPTYNRGAMVREAIASVLAQRDIDCELIVVDDGSIDGTEEDLAEHAAAHGYQVIRTAHRGVAAARNRGVAEARSEFVAFLDSDDLWMPSKLARQVDFMRANPHLQISQCGERWRRRGRWVNPGRRHRKRGGDFFVDSLRTCLVSPSAAIMRRDFFCALGGFDETLAACEDYDLWLRVLVENEIGLLDEPLVIRRAGHPDQLSTSIPALDRFRIIALLKILREPRFSAQRRDAACEVLIEKCTIYGDGLARRGRSVAARTCYSIANAASAWLAGPDDALVESIALMRSMIQADHDPGASASEALR